MSKQMTDTFVMTLDDVDLSPMGFRRVGALDGQSIADEDLARVKETRVLAWAIAQEATTCELRAFLSEHGRHDGEDESLAVMALNIIWSRWWPEVRM